MFKKKHTDNANAWENNTNVNNNANESNDWETPVKKGAFSSLKDYFKFGDEEIPDILVERAKMIWLLSAAAVVLGSLLMVLLRMYPGIFFCILGGVLLALYGYFIVLSATKKGYDIILGECIRVDYTVTSNIPGTRNTPKRFVIMDGETQELYNLPYYDKKGAVVQEDDLVRIIVPKDVYTYERGGAINFGEIWGYEVVPEMSEDRKVRLSEE